MSQAVPTGSDLAFLTRRFDVVRLRAASAVYVDVSGTQSRHTAAGRVRAPNQCFASLAAAGSCGQALVLLMVTFDWRGSVVRKKHIPDETFVLDVERLM